MTTRFPPRIHQARARLDAFARRWPGVWPVVDEARRLITSREHQPYVFLPLEAASAVLSHLRGQRPGGMIGQQARAAAELACLGAWRMGQIVMRYDPALHEALASTPITGDIPADVLLRLPAWCVYVEHSQQLPTSDGSIIVAQGAYAWLDHDARPPAKDLLWIGWDVPELPLVATSVPLVGSIEQSADAVARAWEESYADGAASRGAPPGMRDAYQQSLPPILSLLLYLCADDPDLTPTRAGQPDRPANPAPVRTRRDGWRLFPADGLQVWDVGVRLGAALRRAYHAEQTGQGGAHAGPRPHIRRAHWHTFLSGPRLRPDGSEIAPQDRRRDLRWMPPIPVNMDDPDALPTTVRPVK